MNNVVSKFVRKYQNLFSSIKRVYSHMMRLTKKKLNIHFHTKDKNRREKSDVIQKRGKKDGGVGNKEMFKCHFYEIILIMKVIRWFGSLRGSKK